MHVITGILYRVNDNSHTPTGTPILRIKDLSRRFGGVVALDSSSLDVFPGEIVSLLGPSGCGKSTLLELIAGHLAPDTGSVEIAGRMVAGNGAWVPPRNRGVGMVFQDYALFPNLSVAANVGFAVARTSRFRSLLGSRFGNKLGTVQTGSAVVDELLDLLQIRELADRYPGELSGGQQQRVAIARALAQRPELLLLDEPFCNLDGSTREQVRGEVLDLLRETGLTCIIVTHDQEEALAISDRVAVMQRGRIMQFDDPETVYRRPLCMEVARFVGRTNVVSGLAEFGEVTTELGTFALDADVAGSVSVIIRPELVGVRRDPQGSAIVRRREFRGHDVFYALELASGACVFAHRPSVNMAGLGERVSIIAQSGSATLAGDEVASSSLSLV